ncbi:hypothetical protein EYF80_000679 [Liparis tanakae]|uniref:Uncharacterized protein n=1 Tax=Liparis tanakae TaxID=230148 RepID=A0A4Z2JHK4_9TELE|nr:hypothetical protein EYF80_000679 [Liparis tanakae]
MQTRASSAVPRSAVVRRAAMSSLASENSPSSIPSPTYQWTKARLAYIRSNLWSNRAQASAIAVVFLSMHTALWTLARSPPGTTHDVDDLLADGVVSTGVVVGSILLTSDQLLRVEQLAIHKHGSGDVLSGSSLTEEGVVGIVSSSGGLSAGHLSVRLDPMFQTVKFPAGISNLDPGLTDVHRDALALEENNNLLPVARGRHQCPHRSRPRGRVDLCRACLVSNDRLLLINGLEPILPGSECNTNRMH